MQVAVPTRCVLSPRKIGPRFPFAESILSEAEVQPYIHDCIIKIIEAGRTYRFRVFFKRHRRLQPNRHLPGHVVFPGDILVMRASALYTLSVVNMRGCDIGLSDYLISR